MPTRKVDVVPTSPTTARFVVEVASVPDRDEAVAEIWSNKEMVAEVRRNTDGRYRLDIYPSVSNKVWSFELEEWLQALRDARNRLD